LIGIELRAGWLPQVVGHVTSRSDVAK